MKTTVWRVLVLSILAGRSLIVADATVRIHPQDFVYLGAFALSAISETSLAADAYGQRGLSFDPLGDPGSADSTPGSLWVTGHDQAGDVFEIGIPEPIVSRRYLDLPKASVLTAPIDFTDGCDKGSSWLAGLEIHRGHLWGSCADWYNVTGKSSPNVLWKRSLDLTDLLGPYRAGGLGDPLFHSNRQGAYLFSIPEGFAEAHLDGRSMGTGFSRNSHGGQLGPTFLAFDPRNPADGYDVFWYRQPGNAVCGNKCDFPGYTPCDSWWGASWVETEKRQAFLLGGVKYEGEVSYSGEWQCDPGFAEILLYDPADFVARTNGKLKPWRVLPYETWRPAEFFNQNTIVGGMAFDGTQGVLYVVEKYAGPDGRSIVHVYRLGNRAAVEVE